MEEQVSSHISDLEGLNLELDDFLSDLHGREESLSDRVKTLEEELSGVRVSAASQIARLEQKEAALNATLQEMRSSLTNENLKAASLISERDDLTHRIQETSLLLEQTKSILADKEAALKEARAEAKGDVSKLSALVEEARASLARENSKLAAALLDKDELSRRLQAAGEQVERSKAALSDKEALLKETRAAAKQKAVELAAAMDQAHSAQRAESDRAEELTANIASLRRQLEEFGLRLEEERGRTSEQKQLVAGANIALKVKEDEIGRVLRAMEDLKADLQLERESVTEREAQLQAAARLREGLQKKLDLAAEENSRSEEGFLLKIELVKKELREQSKRAEDIERKLSAAGSRLEDALDEADGKAKLLAEANAALADKEAQLKDANIKLRDLTQEFTQIKNGSAHESAARAREAAAAMAARVEELENSLEQAASQHIEKFRAVQAELSGLKSDLRLKEEQNAALLAREDTVSRELGDAEEKWKFATAQLNNVSSRLRNSENEIEITQGRLRSVEEERDKFRSAAIKAEAAASAHSARESAARDGEAAGLIAALEEQAAKHTELLRKYDDTVLLNETLAHEKAGLKAEADSLRAALDSAQAAMDAETGEKFGTQAGFTGKLRSLEIELKKKDFALQQAIASSEAAAREAADLRGLLEEREDYAAGEAEAEKIRYAALFEKMHNAENLLRTKEFELEEAREALSSLDGECSLLRRSRAELSEKFSREIQAENEQLKEAQGRIEQRDSVISRLSAAEEELKKEAESLKKEKHSLLSLVRKKSAGAAHSAKVSEAERLLADKESRLVKLRSELEHTRVEKAELQGREKELREELKSRPYRAMLREAEDKLSIKERMLAEVTSRMKRIGKDFEELKTRGQSAGAPGYLPDFEELVAGVAHQVANSISIIRSHAEFCAEAPDAEGARESLEVIVRNIVNLQKKIDMIINFSKPVIPQRSPERLSAVVEEVLDGLKTSGRLENFTVKVKGGERLKPVSIDRVRFAAAAEQLIVNAVEAMPGGGEITLSISGGSGKQRFEVSDKGGGIEKKNLASVFHPFFTTRHGKMGLGLTLARNVARAHGGSLELHSEPGGTRAVLELPEIS